MTHIYEVLSKSNASTNSPVRCPTYQVGARHASPGIGIVGVIAGRACLISTK